MRAELEADTGSLWLHLLTAEAALASGRIDLADEALAADALGLPGTGPLIHAQATRFRASIGAAKGDEERADESFKQAAAAFREYGTPFYLACTELEHAEWLVEISRPDEAAPLATEAREIFGRLRATPWLERADELAAKLPVPVSSTS